MAALDAGDTAALPRSCSTRPFRWRATSSSTPTFHYKTGIVFLAWLNGHQDHFRMVGGHQTARSAQHLRRLYELAGQAGVIADPDLAAARFASLA